jgi:hypothetical protein
MGRAAVEVDLCPGPTHERPFRAAPGFTEPALSLKLLQYSAIGSEKGRISMQTVLLVILVLLLIGALPAWPYSAGWGYYPSGALTLLLLIVLVAALVRRV